MCYYYPKVHPMWQIGKMDTLAQSLDNIRTRITQIEARFQRPAGSVRLLAVTKTRPVEDLEQCLALGQTCFGESYLQEALPKITHLAGKGIEWHFIGPLQSNKTQAIAHHFDWVHGVDRLKIAQRLSSQRPDTLPPLNLCIQVNISQEPVKAGVSPNEVLALARQIAPLPQLQLRGLMAIPAPASDIEDQRAAFRAMHGLFDQINAQGIALDTLSMGMSDDMEAAIAEGATIVRIGSALFGVRPTKTA